MSASKPWLEVVRLGQTIVRELGLERSNKFLNRWMAHRVAELVSLAESATDADRQQAQREATDLIMRLWEMRLHWPDGGPFVHILPPLQRITDALEAPPYAFSRYSLRGLRTGGRWLGTLQEAEELANQERLILIYAVFAEYPLELAAENRQWLEEHGEELGEVEREVLERSAELIERIYREDFKLAGQPVPNFGALSPEERDQHLMAALQRLAEKRLAQIRGTSRDEPVEMLTPETIQPLIVVEEEEEAERMAELFDIAFSRFERSDNQQEVCSEEGFPEEGEPSNGETMKND